jgi:hypothetical protein
MLPKRVAASYARALASHFGPGETVTLRRLSGQGAGDYEVVGWVTEMHASDVVGSVQQLRRKVIVLADSVTAADFPTPLLPKQDRLIWNDKTLVITAIDDATRRVQGALVAYELELSGR